MFGKGNDRAFSSTGLESLTKKASRKAREVCGKSSGSMVLIWEHGDILAYVWKRKDTS